MYFLDCHLLLLFVLSLSQVVFAREITFPPVIPVQNVLSYTPEEGTGDARFHGLMTFANLPYVNCFSDEEVEKYDIAFMGAQFDTGVTARPGARFGPSGIRSGSYRIYSNEYFPMPPDGKGTSVNPFSQWAKVVDCGDPYLTFLDNTAALKQLEKAHKKISNREAKAVSKSKVPRTITLGGDHTTTLAALRAAHEHWGKMSVIHFDSHLDTWDPQVLGGGVSEYAGVNHGTFLHVAHEEGLITNSSIHAGIRAPIVRPKGDLRNDVRCGFHIVTAKQIDSIGVAGVVERIKERIGERNVYVSVDIDVLDPAYAPATGTPEVGGWSTREFLAILEGLSGLKVVGADVVEVSPVYDNKGQTTVLAAAEVALELMKLMVKTPVQA